MSGVPLKPDTTISGLSKLTARIAIFGDLITGIKTNTGSGDTVIRITIERPFHRIAGML
jgi:hypothetical protein